MQKSKNIEIKNITDNIPAEEALQHSEARMAAIFDNAEVGLSEISPEGKFISVNGTLCRLLGRTREELLTLSVADVTAREYIQPSMAAVKLLCETGKPQTLDKEYFWPDGTTVWANSSLSLAKTGAGEPVIIVVTFDLNQRKLAEQQVRESEEKYRIQLEQEVQERTEELNQNRELLKATLDSSLDMIQVFKAKRDANGKIIDFKWILNNNTSQVFFGDVIGKKLLEYNPGVVEAGIFEKFVEVAETGTPQQYEIHYVREQFNGWFHQSVVKLDDGVATSTADITARKLAEQEIQALNKALMAKNRQLESLNSELTTFNNIAAYDYQDTLQTLYTNLEYIIKTDAAKLSNAGKANVRKAQGAIQKLKLLTQDIVAFSKLPDMDSNFTTVDLNEVISNITADMADKIAEKSAIIETGSTTLPKIEGFPLLLSLLFYHLLDNALKFYNDDTTPKITVSYRLTGGEAAPSLAETSLHEICITDNGIGFEEKYASKIFDIFYRLHERSQYRGSGVGLAVCKKVMDLHNGYITAKSRPGEGSVFCCYFPAAKA